MKRLLISLAILALLVVANVYSRNLLSSGGNALLQQVDLMESMVDGPAEDLEKICGTFCADWLKTEEVWSRFLRSDRLEQITVTASRLPTYAHYAQRSEVAAGLCEIRVLLQEVLAFELPDLPDLA